MPIIDLLIAAAIIVSVAVGFFRGFIKEAISITALLVAIWAAMYFGPSVGQISDSWLDSTEMQVWFGRILVFAVILSLGGLSGWGLSKLVRLSVLSGADRFFGSVFGSSGILPRLHQGSHFDHGLARGYLGGNVFWAECRPNFG